MEIAEELMKEYDDEAGLHHEFMTKLLDYRDAIRAPLLRQLTEARVEIAMLRRQLEEVDDDQKRTQEQNRTTREGRESRGNG